MQVWMLCGGISVVTALEPCGAVARASVTFLDAALGLTTTAVPAIPSALTKHPATSCTFMVRRGAALDLRLDKFLDDIVVVRGLCDAMARASHTHAARRHVARHVPNVIIWRLHIIRVRVGVDQDGCPNVGPVDVVRATVVVQCRVPIHPPRCPEPQVAEEVKDVQLARRVVVSVHVVGWQAQRVM